MSLSKKMLLRRQRRTWRNRNRLKEFGGARLRLSVFRSNKHISAQVVDDVAGVTLASCSTVEPQFRSEGLGGNTVAAMKVGKELGRRCLLLAIRDVYFDRGPYRYHGRIAALADGVRSAGVEF